MPAKLNQAQVNRSEYRPSSGTDNQKQVLWDPSFPGFGVRVYPSGRKAYVLSYRASGRKRLLTIGPAHVFTVDQARARARKTMTDIIDGKDPLAERNRGASVKELCEAYLERYAKDRKKTWKEDERRINAHLLPALGHLKIHQVRKADLAALHRKIGKQHPYEANRILELASKIFELGKQWDFLEENGPNPARGIEAYREKKRDRFVTPEEMPRLAEAIKAEKNLYVQAAIWLYLLTGLRKSELLQAKWEDIDWDRKELRLGDTKAGRIHYVPLSQPVIDSLENLPKQEGNPYLLPGLKPGSHLVNISKPWDRIRKAAGIEDVRLHDLRRTVGSWLAQDGTSLHLIGKVLNHSNPGTTAVYARFTNDPVRKALESHGKHLLEAAASREGEDPK